MAPRTVPSGQRSRNMLDNAARFSTGSNAAVAISRASSTSARSSSGVMARPLIDRRLLRKRHDL
jgi:hypothetical protein